MSEKEVELFFENLSKLPLIQQLRLVYKTMKNRNNYDAIIETPQHLQWIKTNEKIMTDSPLELLNLFNENATDEEIEAYLINKKLI